MFIVMHAIFYMCIPYLLPYSHAKGRRRQRVLYEVMEEGSYVLVHACLSLEVACVVDCFCVGHMVCDFIRLHVYCVKII